MINNGTKRTKNSKGSFFIIFGAVLIAAAVALVIYNIAAEKSAEHQTIHVINVLKEDISLSESTPSGDTAYDTVHGEEPSSETEIPNYILDPEMEMPTVQIDGNDYIGILEIPSLELTLPVLNDWSYRKLNISPCRYSGSAYTENFVIAAHNYVCHFANIPYLSEGDEIRFTDAAGNTFIYSVCLVETVGANAVEDMTESGFDLTLFTCNYTGGARIAVRCDKTE